MTVQQIKENYAAQPFIPFRIYYPSGPSIDVTHPEWMSFSPTGRIVTIWTPDERWKKVDVALITALESLVSEPNSQEAS